MQNTPDCTRCGGSRTQYYRHTFSGGFHIGVYCLECRTNAQSGRPWYSRNAFSAEEIDAMPDLVRLEYEADPRQAKLF